MRKTKGGIERTEGKGQRTEDGSRRTEVRRQRTEDGGRRTEEDIKARYRWTSHKQL